MISPRRAEGRSLELLAIDIAACRRCPRLVEHREKVGRQKRRAYRDETYWARPVPGFGDPDARLVIVGLAPGAHGSNRTGRMFTGDRSGDFLYPALFRAGLASRGESTGRDDGLVLRGAFITSPVRCVPPDNLPSAPELAQCSAWFRAELSLLPSARAYLALGRVAWKALHDLAGEREAPFAHGARTALVDPSGRSRHSTAIFASYHVSQQNTQTGRLTAAMFDRVVADACREAGLAEQENATEVRGG